MAEREPLTEAEMVTILEDIARDGGNQAARIAAIKVLREVNAGKRPISEGFAALDQPAQRVGARLKAV